jgi:lipopolysaccharide biosynthesis glycosyltransferase
MTIAPTQPDAQRSPVLNRHQTGTTAPDGRVSVLMCTDAAYLQHVGVCLTSLLSNNRELFFDVVLVHRASETLDIGKLRRSLQRFANYTLTPKLFTPPSNIALPIKNILLPLRNNYSIDTWCRLWIEEFFADDVERVLYLDGDIVVVGSIAELWHIDLEGHLLGAVDIPGANVGVTCLGLRPEDGYFNAGVLLIDLKQWRQTHVSNTLLAHVSSHPDQLKFGLDQGVLNVCLHARKKRLDAKWNTIWTFFQERDPVPLSREAIESARRDACIIHFNGLKPWSYFCKHPRQSEYTRYLSMTEWRDFVPPDRTLVNRMRRFGSAVLPARLKTPIKRFLSLRH